MIITVSVFGVELVVNVDYTPPTPDYYSPVFGNLLPGDAAECTINSVIANGDILLLLSNSMLDTIASECCLTIAEVEK